MKGRRRTTNPIGYRGTLAERFDGKWIPEPNSGCWLWVGSVDRKGYGQLRLAKAVLRYATHIALELDGRSLPKGAIACHHCDVPACVNPAHLFVGTPKDNTADMMRKGREKPPPRKAGEAANGVKLTEREVRSIRGALESGVVLSERYGVTEANISAIRHRKTWRDVT